MKSKIISSPLFTFDKSGNETSQKYGHAFDLRIYFPEKILRSGVSFLYEEIPEEYCEKFEVILNELLERLE